MRTTMKATRMSLVVRWGGKETTVGRWLTPLTFPKELSVITEL